MLKSKIGLLEVSGSMLIFLILVGILVGGSFEKVTLSNWGEKRVGEIEVKEISKELFEPIENGGNVEKVNYNNREAYVYLPYGYDENNAYRIMYFMHGGASGSPQNANTIFELGQLKPLLDNMIANGDITPFIFVSLSWSPDASPYNFATNDILPTLQYFENNYSTIALYDVSEENLYKTRYGRYFGGFSNGAYCTWMMLNTDNYKYFSCFYPCSAYGANYIYPIETIDTYEEPFVILDFIGEYESGESGTPAWNTRKMLYEKTISKSHIYLQGYGKGHVHTVMSCMDYLYTSILYLFS